jgi:putative transposase
MSNRRTHSPEFKAKVAMEAISGRKTLQQIAADHAVHPIQVSQWKKQLLAGASELFSPGKKSVPVHRPGWRPANSDAGRSLTSARFLLASQDETA